MDSFPYCNYSLLTIGSLLPTRGDYHASFFVCFLLLFFVDVLLLLFLELGRGGGDLADLVSF